VIVRLGFQPLFAFSPRSCAARSIATVPAPSSFAPRTHESRCAPAITVSSLDPSRRATTLRIVRRSRGCSTTIRACTGPGPRGSCVSLPSLSFAATTASFERSAFASRQPTGMQGIFGSASAISCALARRASFAPGFGDGHPGVEGSPGTCAIGLIEPRCASQSGFHGPSGHVGPFAGPSSSASLKRSTALQPYCVARSTLIPR
jgi:hypothetical protein